MTDAITGETYGEADLARSYLGVSIRNLQCASFRPGFLSPCACRTSHHSFWSACFSSGSLGKKGKTTGSWHSPARSSGLLPAMCFAWSFSWSYPSNIEHRVECAVIARECGGFSRRRTHAIRTGPLFVSRTSCRRAPSSADSCCCFTRNLLRAKLGPNFIMCV